MSLHLIHLAKLDEKFLSQCRAYLSANDTAVVLYSIATETQLSKLQASIEPNTSKLYFLNIACAGISKLEDSHINYEQLIELCSETPSITSWY